MFVFKLQSVLDFRRNIEEKYLNEFSEKKRELEEEKLKLKNLKQERANLIETLRKMEGRSVHADDISICFSYVERLREEEKKQKEVIARVEEELEVKRQVLLEAVKKKKVMEKLRERHAEEYESIMSAFEQKSSDEMAVLKFGRR